MVGHVCTLPEQEANAAFIVRAVNNHDALAAALREILADEDRDICSDAEEQARAALAALEVQP
jgi:hypothetical protein